MITPLDIDKIIGHNLRRIRIEKKLGQEEFAQKIRISKQRLSAYENAKEGLGKDVMARICTFFNVELFEFYIQENSPLPSSKLQLKCLNIAKKAEEVNAAYVAEELAEFGSHRIEKIKKAQDIAHKSKRIRAKAG